MTKQQRPTPDGTEQEDALDNNRPGERDLPGEKGAQPEAADASPASQLGRARTGGGGESALDPDEDVREGWQAPDQSDVPSEWPEPTVD